MVAQEPEHAAVVRPLVFPYVPLGQGAQATAPAAAHVPGTHGDGEDVLSGQALPAGQAPAQFAVVSPGAEL